MRDLKDIIARQHGERPAHDDPLIESLIAELLGAAEEVCVLRDRLDTCERLAGDVVSPRSIDDFDVPVDVTEQRLARHRQYFEALFERLGASGQP